MFISNQYVVANGHQKKIVLPVLPSDIKAILVLTDFQIHEPGDILVTAYTDYPCWNFMVKNACEIDEHMLPQGCCQLFYYPSSDYTIRFRTTGKYILLSLYVSPGFLQSLRSSYYILRNFTESVKRKKRTSLTALPIAAGLEIQSMIQKILRKMASPEANMGESADWIKHLLYLYLRRTTSYIIIARQKRIPTYDQDRIYYLGEYILRNLTEHFTIKKLAREAGVNEFRLKKEFKRVYGLTPFKFIMRARLNKARQLLDTTDLPLNTISGETGFSSISHFSKVFKKQLGISPSHIKFKGIA